MRRSLLIWLVAFGVRLVALKMQPANYTPWSDGAQYVNLAASVAAGKGYCLDEGNFWPGQPTIIRAPGWPVMLASVFRVVPRAWRWPAARLGAAALDSVNALLSGGLAASLGAGPPAALCAALLYALSPVLAGLSALPASEVPAITFVLAFLICVARTQLAAWRHAAWAGVLLGLAGLVRTNLLPIAAFTALGLLWVRRRTPWQTVLLLIVFALGVSAPIAPWVLRNARVFHRFPVLGAGGGETFCAGNNDRAAQPGDELHGYIVQLQDLPGQEPLWQLAARMNECEVDAYLFHEGWGWLSAHKAKLPGLVAAKLWRAYVPSLHSRSPTVLAGNLYRWATDVLAMGGLWLFFRGRRRIATMSVVALAAVLLTHAAVAAAFCGVPRYVLPSEVLLLIPAGAALARLLAWRLRLAASADPDARRGEGP